MEQEMSLLDIINDHVNSEKTKLPVFNKTSVRIKDEASREDSSIRKIEKLIVCDQALTSQVLKMANSSFFRGISVSPPGVIWP